MPESTYRLGGSDRLLHQYILRFVPGCDRCRTEVVLHRTDALVDVKEQHRNQTSHRYCGHESQCQLVEELINCVW